MALGFSKAKEEAGEQWGDVLKKAKGNQLPSRINTQLTSQCNGRTGVFSVNGFKSVPLPLPSRRKLPEVSLHQNESVN